MESINKKILPKDLSRLVRKTLYFKFFTILFLNNIFWLIYSFLPNPQPMTNDPHLPTNFAKIVIKTTISEVDLSLGSLALINDKEEVISKSIKVLKFIGESELDQTIHQKYLIALPIFDYVKVLKKEHELYKIVPKESLIYLNEKIKKEINYEIVI